MKREKLALYGIVISMLGVVTYLIGVLMALPRRLLLGGDFMLQFNESLVWYSGIPILIGLTLIVVDLFVLYPKKRTNEYIFHDPIKTNFVTVVLTAYNDEGSIKSAVREFQAHPFVKRVVVISNNSSDNTLSQAIESGAVAYNEETQGYGACVHRALSEGIKFYDTELTILCEGDMTFRAYDIDKLLAYISHADIVNGTRIVEQLRDKNTQLSTFMFYGNYFVAKLLEIKHLGNATFTDVGTTYKLCRNSALRDLLPKLDNTINLEFNPYFLDRALENGFKVIECPITFHKRVGQSKGGNVSNMVAFKLGLKMIRGILLDWQDKRAGYHDQLLGT
jgi:glycosyltransferase involved in cell wall biosynthesis